jgi:PhnB protein
MSTRAIPEGYHTITPYLIIQSPSAVIAFLKEAFGAEELFRMDLPDGRLMHGEVRLGDSKLMIAEATAEWPAQPGVFYMYVEDVDATYRRAVDAGAEPVMEPADQFYGDRHGGVRDAAGNQWWIATRVEEVGEEELMRRQEAEIAKMSGPQEAAGTQA